MDEIDPLDCAPHEFTQQDGSLVAQAEPTLHKAVFLVGDGKPTGAFVSYAGSGPITVLPGAYEATISLKGKA